MNFAWSTFRDESKRGGVACTLTPAAVSSFDIASKFCEPMVLADVDVDVARLEVLLEEPRLVPARSRRQDRADLDASLRRRDERIAELRRGRIGKAHVELALRAVRRGDRRGVRRGEIVVGGHVAGVASAARDSRKRDQEE